MNGIEMLVNKVEEQEVKAGIKTESELEKHLFTKATNPNADFEILWSVGPTAYVF